MPHAQRRAALEGRAWRSDLKLWGLHLVLGDTRSRGGGAERGAGLIAICPRVGLGTTQGGMHEYGGALAVSYGGGGGGLCRGGVVL